MRLLWDLQQHPVGTERIQHTGTVPHLPWLEVYLGVRGPVSHYSPPCQVFRRALPDCLAPPRNGEGLIIQPHFYLSGLCVLESWPLTQVPKGICAPDEGPGWGVPQGRVLALEGQCFNEK